MSTLKEDTSAINQKIKVLEEDTKTNQKLLLTTLSGIYLTLPPAHQKTLKSIFSQIMSKESKNFTLTEDSKKLTGLLLGSDNASEKQSSLQNVPIFEIQHTYQNKAQNSFYAKIIAFLKKGQ